MAKKRDQPDCRATAAMLPCPHRGAALTQVISDRCGSKGQPFDVLSCDHANGPGRCTVASVHTRIKSCLSCRLRPEAEISNLKSNIRSNRRRYAAPLRSDAVTINLPHHSTPELLEATLPLWLAQTVPTVIDVVDTGSTRAVIDRVRTICHRMNHEHGERVRLHTIAPRTWRHMAEPVAIACEFSQLFADSERILFSHVDVFPRRRDLVEWLATQCTAEQPVVGYEISSRDHVQGRVAQLWRGMVGHTLTMTHAPTLRWHGITWDFERGISEFGLSPEDARNWDTEITFNLALQAAGITPLLVGHDENYTHKVDQWHGHARSYPSATIFGADHAAKAAPWVAQEIHEAQERLQQWKQLTAN